MVNERFEVEIKYHCSLNSFYQNASKHDELRMLLVAVYVNMYSYTQGHDRECTALSRFGVLHGAVGIS